jgi:hypothetical protein
MHSPTQRKFAISILFLLAPVVGYPSSISVNGACDVGVCSPVDTLGIGDSSSGTFDFNASVNGDPYNIFGSYSAANPPSGDTALALNLTAVYTGSSPTTQTDVLTINQFQDYTVTSPSGTYFEDITAGLGGPLGTGSSLTAQLFYNGQGLGQLGPFSSSGSGSASKSLTLSSPLDADAEFVLDFGPGSENGSYMTTTPEPAGLGPLAVVLALGLGLPAVRRCRELASNRNV